jgi:hypothetical protein
MVDNKEKIIVGMLGMLILLIGISIGISCKSQKFTHAPMSESTHLMEGDNTTSQVDYTIIPKGNLPFSLSRFTDGANRVIAGYFLFNFLFGDKELTFNLHPGDGYSGGEASTFQEKSHAIAMSIFPADGIGSSSRVVSAVQKDSFATSFSTLCIAYDIEYGYYKNSTKPNDDTQILTESTHFPFIICDIAAKYQLPTMETNTLFFYPGNYETIQVSQSEIKQAILSFNLTIN